MPWRPHAGNRSRTSYSTRDIDFDVDDLLTRVRIGIHTGLNEVGEMAYAYAKKHAPVRKVFHGERGQGGGVRKGMRTLTDVEVAAEAEDRTRLGLGPGHGVRTLGRPGTHPGRPRAPQNYQIAPGFGQVGMPHGEAPYNPNFTTRQQMRPGKKEQALDLARYADRQQAILEGMVTPMRRVGNSRKYGAAPSQPLPAGHPARTYRSPPQPPTLITNQREVQQADIRRDRGGQLIREEEHLDQPKRRVDSKRRRDGRKSRFHYVETTGSLRVREARDDLPHGAYGRYEPVVAEITDAMTGRGKYEAGINISRGSQHAGRAVILNPDTQRLQVGGRLKHNITKRPASLGDTVMTFWVDSPTYYTRYVEFGTRHAHAQPFLRPAVGHVREQMRDRIKKAIRSSVRR